jgi:hypothetical protein
MLSFVPMPPAASLLICLASLAAVIAMSRYFGRVAGIFTAATCGVSVAFVMPPAFSFEIDSIADQTTLAAFGAMSLFVLYRIPGLRRGIFPYPSQSSPAPAGTPLSTIMRDVVPAGIAVSIADLEITTPAARAEQALREVLQDVLSQPSIVGISVYGGRLPGEERIWVAARYRDLPEEPCLLMAKRNTRGVTVFDNGYERVYSISLCAGADTIQ